jgi:8-oxo-dGTP pyrophosphatase MutT (NUDIX family)
MMETGIVTEAKKQYVVGFLFDPAFERLWLIEKKRPAWQAGLWNGIGGKVEPGESIFDAMAREAREEIDIGDETPWTHYVSLQYVEAEIHFFWANGILGFSTARAVTDEEIAQRRVADWLYPDPEGRDRLILNLRFLIPMAVHSGRHETMVPAMIGMCGSANSVSQPK